MNEAREAKATAKRSDAVKHPCTKTCSSLYDTDMIRWAKEGSLNQGATNLPPSARGSKADHSEQSQTVARDVPTQCSLRVHDSYRSIPASTSALAPDSAGSSINVLLTSHDTGQTFSSTEAKTLKGPLRKAAADDSDNLGYEAFDIDQHRSSIEARKASSSSGKRANLTGAPKATVTTAKGRGTPAQTEQAKSNSSLPLLSALFTTAKGQGISAQTQPAESNSSRLQPAYVTIARGQGTSAQTQQADIHSSRNIPPTAYATIATGRGTYAQIQQAAIIKTKKKTILTSGSKTGSQTDSSDGLAATVLPS